MTNGTIDYAIDKRSYVLQDVPPNVAVRLKRIFAKVNPGEFGRYLISDSLENARDLLWFLERYPMEGNPKVLERLRIRSDAHLEQQRLVQAILDGTAPPAKPVDLALPMREYQTVVGPMVFAGGGILLADHVGLGKTISAIGTIADERARPSLFVTLTHLPIQMAREIRRFAPKMRVTTLNGTRPYDLRKGACYSIRKHNFVADREAPGGSLCTRCWATRDDVYHGRTRGLPDVVVTSYSKLPGWAEVLAGYGFRSLVFDEVQELRRHEEKPGTPTKKYAAATHVRQSVGYCLGLSATPIYNYGGEFHAVLDIIRPDALGTRDEFTREWCSGGQAGKELIRDPNAFGVYLRTSGLMLRRTRKDVGRELPAVQVIPHHVESDAAPLEQIKSACADLAKRILSRAETYKGEQMHIAGEFSNKLREATGVAKAPYVADFVRMLVESGEKVVLFGFHHAVYDLWRERLKDLNPAFYTGNESVNQKEDAKRRFINGTTDILVLSLRAGAGLDGLQYVCRTVVEGELDYSPGVREQCFGRVARDGQEDPVTIYSLIAETGSDPIIADMLGVKRSQIEGVVDPNAEMVEKLEVDPEKIRKLAAGYLRARGEKVDGLA